MAKCCFFFDVSRIEAESFLSEAPKGTFLIRKSSRAGGHLALSVKVFKDQEPCISHFLITHQHYYELLGKRFYTLTEMVHYYRDNPDKLNTRLHWSLYSEDVTHERFFHGQIEQAEAESICESQADGSYLFHASTSNPGDYVLTIKVADKFFNVLIKYHNNTFQMGNNLIFNSLSQLIEQFRTDPIINDEGRVIQLGNPIHSTSFLPIFVTRRVAKLQFEYDGFWKEFEEIQQQKTRSGSYKEGRKVGNRPKNRSKNILPFDHTRVVLKEGYDLQVPGSDYINASYVHGEVSHSVSKYIVTQGCLPATINDFWRMEEVENAYVVRKFGITHKAAGESRHIFQFHFKAWPDHGVPDPGVLLTFIEDINATSLRGPWIVQCAMGCGRTGALILIDSILNTLKVRGLEIPIDISKSITIARMQRANLIQSFDQYKLVYKCIMQYVEIRQCVDKYM
uniref:protein-tyrosine-phosphatase n=1 Tax=Amphimedon queenslandica TaxID=400682 RepID=A0A1X7UP78_AMPQE